MTENVESTDTILSDVLTTLSNKLDNLLANSSETLDRLNKIESNTDTTVVKENDEPKDDNQNENSEGASDVVDNDNDDNQLKADESEVEEAKKLLNL